MKWTTERPAEPGFYFATDGSPVLVLQIIGADGIIDEFGTWQSKWYGRSDIPEDSMSDEAVVLPVSEPKYWCKIPLPPQPEDIY